MGTIRGNSRAVRPKRTTNQVTKPTDNIIQHGHRSCTNTKRKSRRQARQDIWQQGDRATDIKNKYRNFQKGAKTFKRQIIPSHEDLSRSVQHGHTALENPHYYEPNGDSISKNRLELAKDQEVREMSGMIELLEDGGVGYMPEKKGQGWVRIMFENWNSLGVYTQSWKIDRLNYLVKRHNIDIVAGCECQTDWTKVDNDNQFHSILTPGRAKKGIASHNTTERIHRGQPGGTAIAGIGRICDVIKEVGSDKTGLGRWSWVSLHGGSTTTRIISAYLPRRPNKHSKGRTVWEQHSRYFEGRGDMRYPATIFIEDLLRLIKPWITSGDHVILAIDANQDVYSGKLARELATEPINMTCLMQRAVGEKVPNSHFSGKGQISTIFGSPGVVTGNGMCYPHWYGIGDHRVMVLEIAALAAFEGSYPTISTPTARILSCRTKRHKEKYCKRLRQLVSDHKMDERLQRIGYLTDEQYTLEHNQWDNELGDYMRSAERHCSHYKDGSIEFSPTVGQWLRKRSILKWIIRWQDGKVPDVRNLLRAAKRMHIENPLELQKDEVEARLVSCINEIYNLRRNAPALRDKHLKWRLSLASKREDTVAVQEINRIRRNEARKRRQQIINRSIRDPKGRAVLQVEIDTQSGTQTLDTQQDIEHHVQQNLQQRFSLGKRAPLNAGHLLEDFGTLGDTDAVTQLFQGTYKFHPTVDKATADYLREAARIHNELATLPSITTEVTTEEYISFWSKAKENTSSSKSGRHFGHYKAICSDPDLVALQLANINHAATRGSPLSRWSNGVTVLLEKVAGSKRIEKLRAICLLEADFNWWLKVIFARRMLNKMTTKGAIPLEQGAVKGKTPTNTTLLKQLYFDQANILHENCALASTDAANCYDAVNHAAASIALQATGMDRELVLCYLRCIQSMRYYLRTGYGLANSSYGSSQDSICMGLTQGSGASPGVWTAVSTVIIGAYKHEGYGAQLVGGWSPEPISLAALLYVDDTDLLHNRVTAEDSQEMLIPWVQQATTHWANLLQATGGNLNPSKCYWYLLQYKFDQGEASLVPRRHLLNNHLTIPQPNGRDVEIILKDPAEASEVLGVLVSPVGDGEPMLQHMINKGYKWSRRVLNSKLNTTDAWFSFRTQAMMSVRYGLIPLMASWHSIEHTLSKWYYHCLPALGVNRTIGHEWRMLPVEYQGLGLPNLALEKLAESLQLLQRHWSRGTDLGKALRLGFELVQVETGLQGNFLLRNYNTYGRLATHTWFKQLWETVHHFGVEVVVSDDMIVPPIRENDKVLMEEALKILPYHQWVPFNRARKHFQIYFLSHLIMGNGTTVHPTAIDPSLAKHRPTDMRFPKEQPTDTDFKIWNQTIRRLTSPTLTLSPPLGRFLRACPEYNTWQTNMAHAYVVQQNKDKSYDVYYPTHQHAHTRGHNYFEYHHTTTHQPPCTLTASVIPRSTHKVALHSTCSLKPHPHTPAEPFLTKLRKGFQSHVWRSSQFDEDGEWIIQAIEQGTLLIVHDGSYMPQIDKSICAAGIVLLCSQTGRMGTIQCCEKSNRKTASNYRGELIGALITSQILKVASTHTSSNRTVQLYCDNLGVIHHASHPERPTKDKQPQSDVITLVTYNLATSTIPWRYQHIYSHLDDTIEFQNLSLPEKLNVMADKLAKEALLDAAATGIYCQPYYPHENIRVLINGNKATASIKSHLYQEWGKQVARDLFHNKHIISEQHFDYVNWEGLRLAMNSLPQMYKVWVTKHVSGACATNRHLSKMDSRVPNKCSCCGRRNESILHITRCTNEGRRRMFDQTVKELVQWMTRSCGHPDIIQVVESYLTYRGRVPMKRICQDTGMLKKFAQETDRLGWRNFTEAKISNTLFDTQEEYLMRMRSKWQIETWSKHFLTRILNITHRQWLYRNSRIHMRNVEGLSAADHESILEKVRTLIGTDPTDILPKHRSLLHMDFEALGEGTSTDRQYWIAQMESAITAQKRRRNSNNVDYDAKRQRRM